MFRRVNPDENIQKYYRGWLSGDAEAGIKYAAAKLRSGELDIAELPINILNILFPDRVIPYNVYLRGIRILNIINQLRNIVDNITFPVPQDSGSVDSLVWLPTLEQLIFLRNWRWFSPDRQNFSESDLHFNYGSLQLEIDSSILDQRAIPVPEIQYITQNYSPSYESPKGWSHPYFILWDDVPDDWESIPNIIYGRCEDFPACGHDLCPPREEQTGKIVGQVCVCGAIVSLNSGYSLCRNCLTRSVMYGYDEFSENNYVDEFEDDGEDDGDY